MTTKEQERKALAQIRKIVEGLGEGSYIGTALEGCLEIADSNIDCDFGDSMKARADHYEKLATERAEELKQVYTTLHETDLEAKEWKRLYNVIEKDALEDLTRQVNTITELRAERDNLLTWQEEVREKVRPAITSRIEIVTQNMLNSADIMDDLAYAPNDIAYTRAREQYRKYREELRALRDGLRLLDND